MAITKTSHDLLRSLTFPQGGTLLEIGEANWFGDIDPASVGLDDSGSQFDVCKQLYRQLFAPEKCVAIDQNGSKDALRLDLNQPIDLKEQFDVVINNGTAEHVFNIAQVFKTMHEHCSIDGLMIHDAPLLGWIDHGFYTLQPTLFWDLATANCYEIAKAAIHEIKSQAVIPIERRNGLAGVSIPAEAMLFVAFKKRFDVPFSFPMQGRYK